MCGRRIGVFFSLVPVAAAVLCGCGTKAVGGGQDNSRQAAAGAESYIYTEEEITLEGLNISDVSYIAFADGRFIVSGAGYGDTEGSFYMTFDEDGRQLSSYETTQGEKDGSFVIGSNGDIYAIMTKDVTEESGDNISYRMEQYLVRRDSVGTEKERISLSARASAEEYFYATRIFSDGRGGLVIAANGVLMLFDEEDGFVKLIKLSADINEMLLCRDESIILTVRGEKGMILRLVDTAAGQITGEYTLSQNGDYSCYSGMDCDLLFATDKAVYRYNLGDAEPEKLMDYADSGVDAYSLYNLIPMGEEGFYAMYISAGDGTAHFSRFTRAVPVLPET